jgi:hypothetical protein
MLRHLTTVFYRKYNTTLSEPQLLTGYEPKNVEGLHIIQLIRHLKKSQKKTSITQLRITQLRTLFCSQSQKVIS